MTRQYVEASETFVVDHAIRCGCGNRAVSLLETHAVDCCTSDEPTEATFVCNSCLGKTVALVDELLGDCCAKCGLEFVTLSDIIVRQCPIERR